MNLSNLVTAIGVAAYCLFVQDTSVNTAFGSGFGVVAIDGWRGFLSDWSATKSTINAPKAHLPTLGHAIATYALLTNQEWASEYVKYWCYFGLANAIAGILDTSKWLMMYGYDENIAKDDVMTNLFMRSAAFSIAAYGTLCLMILEYNVNPFKAFAYASAIFASHFVWAMYIAKDTENLGMKESLFKTLLAVFAIMFPLLLHGQ